MNLYKKIFKIIHKSFNFFKIYDLSLIKIKRIKNINFGDYQIYGLVNFFKIKKIKFNLLLKIIKKNFEKTIFIKKIKICKFNIINIFIDNKWLENKINNISFSYRIGVEKIKNSKNIVIDYSSPNMAKELHVGHLRSTIIGDSMFRILSFLGYKVIKSNHIGDWGWQFGAIIAYLKTKKINISKYNIENIYYKSKNLYKYKKNFNLLSDKYTLKLQNNNIKYTKIWRKIINISKKENNFIYNLLNVNLTDEDIYGESFYKNIIPGIIKDLLNKNIAKKEKNFTLIKLKKFKNKAGKTMGIIIKKNNGIYLYPIIDIACIKYRVQLLKANRIIYYIDSRQNRYLSQIWEISKKAGYINEKVSLEHHCFGMILNKNKKPFKTRSGKNIKLKKLLLEAISKAKNLLINKRTNLNKKNIEKISQNLGIGSIKYFDLSRNRKKDYIFKWKEILKLNGNTCPYIQYSYVRIISIIKKLKINLFKFKNRIILNTKTERKIFLKIIQLEEIITEIKNKSMVNILCNYLYDISVLFNSFYEESKIITEKNILLKLSKIQLIILIARVIKKSLNFLGIKTVEVM
ncbi:MAG: arginine--tRNA ligase [Enterobacteriaceae bacterium]